MPDSAPQDPSNSFEESSVDPQSVEGLFLTALSKSTPQEREAFLDEACGDDAERRRRIEALLRAYDDAGSFLDKPPAGVPTEIDPQNFDFLEPSDDPGLLGTLGPYEIYEVIGRGGMGIVFRARDPKLNRVVAVKVLAPALAANPNAKRRFVREAQAGAAISHPHVVTIHAVDEDEKIPYLVMECIVGQSLQEKLDKVGSLRLTEMLRISKQVGEGLAAAHKQGLIHRDIKPANILLENGVERVKITDFGLARAVDDVSMTRTGEVAGSPQFMSPEQALGERVDQRSDLFSLGCVMYAMCVGRSPFRASNIAAAIRRVCDDHPRPIEEINPEVPEWLIAIIEKLLDKNPDERFQTAEELVAVLEDHLAGVQGMAQGTRRPVREANFASPARTKTSGGTSNHPRKLISPFWILSAFVCVVVLLDLFMSRKIPQKESMFSPLVIFLIVVSYGILVSVKLLQNLKLRADDEPKTENLPTQKFASQVSTDGPPLLERLSSSLMRLALIGPVFTLGAMFVWANFPTMTVDSAVNFTVMGVGAVLWGSVLIGWMGSHLQRVEWGWEAYYKGIVASVLSLLLPIVWIIGIPTGLASLWVLNQKRVIDSYRRKGAGEAVSLPIPKMLLDIGTFVGVALTSFLLFILSRDGRFTLIDVLEVSPVLLGIILLIFPIRGELFRGRFQRDFILSCVGFVMTGFVYWLFRARQDHVRVMGAEEVAVICLIAFVLFVLPTILIWKFLIQPSLKQSPKEQIPLAQSSPISPRQKWSLGKRLLFGCGIGVAVIGLQVLVPQVQKMKLPPGRLTIHHNGDVKPVEVRIDGKLVFISRQSGIRTDITGLEIGLRDIQISMKGSSENLVRNKHYQINIRPGRNHEITLRLPVKTNAGMELGPASKEYGGLILEIPDPDLWVLLMRLDPPAIGFRSEFFTAGEHQVPAGKYQVVVLDQMAGWLLDVKSDKRNQQSYDQVYNAINRIYGGGAGGYGGAGYGSGLGGMSSSESAFGGVNLQSRPGIYDRKSGNWSLIQYAIGSVDIKPGEFETVVAKRDWKQIALAHEEFVSGKFYRFLWNKKKYSLSATQARVVNELLQAYTNEDVQLTESTVLDAIKQEGEETPATIKAIFNDGKHPAWGGVVESLGDKNLQLTQLSGVDKSIEIPKGMRVLTIPVTWSKDEVLPSLPLGDWIDVQVTYQIEQDGKQQTKTRTLLDYVQVVQASSTERQSGIRPNQEKRLYISLLLNPVQVNYVKTAESAGTLSFSKRKLYLSFRRIMNAAFANEHNIDEGLLKELQESLVQPFGAFPQPKETGAVILTQKDRQMSVVIRLNENGLLRPLSEQTTSIPVGKYFVKVYDHSYGWGSAKSRGMTAPSYDGEPFIVKKGEFTDLEIKRNWKKLAAQEPVLMEGFYPFIWDGKDYILSKEQSKIVQQIFQAQTAEKIAVEAASLVDSEDAAEEIKRIFNNGKHPAWSNLVRPLGDDKFRLKLDQLGHLMIIRKDLQISFLQRMPHNFLSNFKHLGQTFDILISTEKGVEPVPLITNASVFSVPRPSRIQSVVISL